jgi:putative PEP-CTERM system TPR-repeat lipoprotein
MKINNKLTLAISMAISLTACSPNMTSDEYVAQAKVALEDGDTNSAIIALKNAVRIEPKNPNVRFELGAAYLAQGDYSGSEKELEKAEELGSDNESLMTYLVQTKIKLNKFDYVYQLVEQVDTLTDSDQVMLLTYAGIAAIHQNKDQLAKEYIEDAISISEDSIYGTIGKAYLSHSDNNYRNGLRTVDELLNSQPNFAEAVLLKGYLLQASEQFDEAAKVYEQYSKLRPKDMQAIFFIAQNYVFSQNYDAAEKYVNLLLKISESHPLANQLKAEIEYSRKNYKSAKEYALKSLQENKHFNVSKVIAGVSAYKLGNFEQSYQYLTSVKDILPPKHLVRNLIIDLQFKLGYEADTVLDLQSLADIDAADPAMLTMVSNKFITSGNIEVAEELLKSSIATATSDPTEIAKQGVTQLRLNQTEQGIERLEEALKLDPELAFAEQSLALGYIRDKQYDKALEIAKKWQQNEEGNIQGLLLESAILDEQNKKKESYKLLIKVLELDSKNVPALYKLAVYAHQDENIELAFDYYTQLLMLQPNHIRAMINFTRFIGSTIDDGDNIINRAINFYNTELSSNPENNSFKLGLAYIYIVDSDNDAAIKLLEEIAKSKAPLKGIGIVLGDTYKKQKNWEAAIVEYQKYLDINPKSLKVVQKILSTYEHTGQIFKGLAQVDKALIEYPDNTGLLLTKSYYQSQLEMVPAEDDLDKIKANTTTANHWILDKTLGNLAYNKRNFNDSAKFYAEAYQKNNNDVNVISWSKSVALNGNKKKAIEILENHLTTLLAEGRSATGIQTMLAGAYINDNNINKASTLYENILKTDPENVIALNNLSYLALQKGNAKKALTYAEKAMSLKGQSAAIIDSYAQALVANRQFELALEQYDKALALDSDNIEFTINKAEVLILTKQIDKAKSLLLSLKTDNEKEQIRIKKLLLDL